MTAQGVLWVAFHVIVLGMLALDLGVLARRTHALSWGEAGGLSALWVLLSLLFGAGVWTLRGHQAGLAFLTGYLLEKSLSVDNMFVFLVIFQSFEVPRRLQPKVLKWGILGALVMRAVFIAAGAVLLHAFAWVVYVFGGVIIWTGIRMLAARRTKTAAAGLPPFVETLRRRIPPSKDYGKETFTMRRGGALVATPLLWALIAVEAADLVFAIDSIPAVFAITTDPFIVYTSNIFAILGLRAMYFLLAGAVDLFRHLHTGLALVLLFVGVKMLVSGVYDIPIGVSLGLIAAILLAAVAGSLLAGDARGKT
jgi:TerC family integral membrane protein